MARTAEEKRLYLRDYYAANKARMNEQSRQWAIQNADKRRDIANKWARSNAEQRRAYKLKSRYGVTPAQYDAMVEAQGGQCSICGTAPGGEKLVVDHMHSTGRVRSLLCRKCNSAIGLLRDDPDVIYAAAAYVRKHNAH